MFQLAGKDEIEVKSEDCTTELILFALLHDREIAVRDIGFYVSSDPTEPEGQIRRVEKVLPLYQDLFQKRLGPPRSSSCRIDE